MLQPANTVRPSDCFYFMSAMSRVGPRGRVGFERAMRPYLELPARSVNLGASGMGTAPRINNPVFSKAPPWLGA
jgi:hypothetical protein